MQMPPNVRALLRSAGAGMDHPFMRAVAEGLLHFDEGIIDCRGGQPGMAECTAYRLKFSIAR